MTRHDETDARDARTALWRDIRDVVFAALMEEWQDAPAAWRDYTATAVADEAATAAEEIVRTAMLGEEG